jgi:hypothetical protein
LGKHVSGVVSADFLNLSFPLQGGYFFPSTQKKVLLADIHILAKKDRLNAVIFPLGATLQGQQTLELRKRTRAETRVVLLLMPENTGT